MEPSDTAPDRAAQDDHQSDLVVAQAHQRVVESVLAELPVTFQEKASDDDLGLALLGLPRLAADVRQLRRDDELVKDALGARRRSGLESPDIPELDLLMFKIRSTLAKKHHGWTPIIGKNRRVEPVHPWGPEIVGGTKGYWVPVDSTAVPISRPTPRRGQAIRVGILDTPLYPHRRLRGSYVAGRESMLSPAPWHLQSAGHATFVAGCVLQNAPAAVLDVRSNLGETGVATVWDSAQTMMTFAGSGVDILNLSWGCQAQDGQPPLVLARAVQLLSREMVIVVAAGNHSSQPGGPGWVPRTAPTFPAALPDVVAVAACDADGQPAEFNPDGPWINLLARGVDVDSTYLKGYVVLHTDRGTLTVSFDGYARGSGTSFAAANVAGELAARAYEDQRSPREVLRDMLNQDPDQGKFQAKPYSL